MDLSGGFFRQAMSNYQKVGGKLLETRTVHVWRWLSSSKSNLSHLSTKINQLNWNSIIKKTSFFEDVWEITHPSFIHRSTQPEKQRFAPFCLRHFPWSWRRPTGRPLRPRGTCRPPSWRTSLRAIHGGKSMEPSVSGKICKIYWDMENTRNNGFSMDQTVENHGTLW